MFYNKYEALCQQLLAMAKNGKVKEQMEAILYEGGCGNFSVNTELTKNNEFIERKKRIGYAYILATNPETFDVITQNNINLFHGTNANALPNILKYGMKSVDKLSSQGISISTGEAWSRIGGKRSFISFTDDIDTSLDYAAFTPESDKLSQESFGVIIGISSKSLEHLKTCRVHSDLPEVGIMNSIPLEHIKTIAVPEDKVEFVRKLVGDNEIIVTPISIDEKFYYVDSEFGQISFDAEKAKQLIEQRKQVTRANFNSKEITEMSRTRKVSGIRNIFEKIRETIKIRGKENVKDR